MDVKDKDDETRINVTHRQPPPTRESRFHAVLGILPAAAAAAAAMGE